MHQGFPSKTVSVATARERGRQAVALAERHGFDDRPIVAPALGAVGGMARGDAATRATAPAGSGGGARRRSSRVTSVTRITPTDEPRQEAVNS